MRHRRLPPAIPLLVVLLAVPLTARSYSVRRTDTGEATHWREGALSIVVDRHVARVIDLDDAQAALEAAATAWNDQGSGPVLSVSGDESHEDPSPADGILGLYAPSRWPADPDFLAVTVSTYEATTGRLVDADVLLNELKPFERFDVEGSPDEDPVVRGGHAYDLDSVLAHELGHVLGLGESEDDEAATMWPRLAKREVHARTLADDDREGVASIYASRATEAATSCSASHGEGAPLALWLVALVLLVARRRATPGVRGGGVLPWLVVLGLVLVASPALGKEPEPTDGGLVELGQRASEGLQLTRFEARDEHGHPVAIEVPGGRFQGLVQRVGEQEPPRPGTVATFHRDPGCDAGWLYLADGSRVRAFVAP